MSAARFFSQSYAEARDKFLAASRGSAAWGSRPTSIR